MNLSHLNSIQQRAVTSTEGPYMVIAGAGSGKTSVLTHRIAYLLEAAHINPSNILALTFTNKAATEMRQRIENMVGPAAKNLWLGTFHSIFARILRKEADRLGYPRNFTIYDTDDSRALLRSIIKEMNLDDQVYKPYVVLARISGAKNRLITAQAYANSALYQADDESARKPHLGTIFLKYVDRCFKAGAMDFDDLIFNTHQLLRYAEVLYKYQECFRYIMIDEFQDTNMAQYAIVKDLAMLHKNICVVGDDAQSIYAFRGADIHNILNFEKDYATLSVIKLEQNYRSTQNIVYAANSIISHNKAQFKKVVWTDNDVGEPIDLIRATTDAEEGRLVAASIYESRANHKLRNNDFAILYRTNSQSRAIEEALRKMNMSYRVVGGMSFYQRKEVKDLLAYLRLLINPNDEAALKRIINLPKRGIGANSVDKMVTAATDHAIPLWKVVCHASSFLGSRVGNTIEEFAAMIQQIAAELSQRDAYDIASCIAKRSGLLKELHEDKTVEGLGRYENVQELLNGVKEFTTNPENEDTSLAAFLQEVALATNADTVDQEVTDKITLMTIHAAKGLEFAYVYVVGMEEGLFPSQLMLESRADLEEERRLFYVAVTRARQRIFLTYAMTRYRFGRLKHCEPSRFITEIDPAYLQMKTQRALQVAHSEGYARRLVSSIARNAQKPPQQTHAMNNFQPSDMTHIEVGMQVAHPRFGRGTVCQLDVSGDVRKAKIDFVDFGEKTLLLSFAKIKILDRIPE
ncbi:MAG: exodeoxyribonuclease V subunit gamma [Amoebophilaceae bacterium]|nr:exodeoxyribonuclease V subunit gamma [Amoebophilaceae bacterium]